MSNQQQPTDVSQTRQSLRDSMWYDDGYDDDYDYIAAYNRDLDRRAADQWRQDMAQWFPDTKHHTQSDDESTWAHSRREIETAIGDLWARGTRLRGSTGYPGPGYDPLVDPRERAQVQMQLRNAVIDWNEASTRKIVSVGPKGEPAPEDEG